jgi:hypothetical protein
MKNTKFTIEITEDGLQTIMAALESYSRLGIYQFRYGLECIPEFFNLSYDAQHEIEEYLKERLGVKYKNYGIFHEAVVPFTKAFEIKCEIEKFVSLKRVDGVREGYSKCYDGAVYRRDYLPDFIGEKDAKEFEIPRGIRPTLKSLAKKKQYDKMWELINKNTDFDHIKGNKSEIAPDFSKVTVFEPYKIAALKP